MNLINSFNRRQEHYNLKFKDSSLKKACLNSSYSFFLLQLAYILYANCDIL